MFNGEYSPTNDAETPKSAKKEKAVLAPVDESRALTLAAFREKIKQMNRVEVSSSGGSSSIQNIVVRVLVAQ